MEDAVRAGRARARRRVLGFAWGAAAGVLGGVVGLLCQEPAGRTVALANGTRLKVVALDPAPPYRFVYGQGWQRALCALLPPPAGDSRRFGALEIQHNPFHQPPPLVLATFRRAGSGVFAGGPQFTLVDSRGVEGELHPEGHLLKDGDRYFSVTELPRVPRRGRSLRIRVYRALFSVTSGCLGEVELDNPLATDPPEWEAQPLPQTRAAGGTRVTLTRLATRARPGPGLRPCLPGEPPWTLLEFAVEPRRPGLAERTVGVRFFDAGGNRWEAERIVQDPGPPRRVYVDCGLWSDEPAYRVELDLANLSGTWARTVKFLARSEVLAP